MTNLVCVGTMGIAILNGILTSLAETQDSQTSTTDAASQTEDVPSRLPSRFIACVRSQESVKRIQTTLKDHSSILKVATGDNVASVKQAEIVLLGCKPYMVKDVLGEPGMADALRGKLLISVCAGITTEHMEVALYGTASDKDPDEDGRCKVVRAMCNTAALIRESMTVIGNTTPPMPQATKTMVTWIFKRVGDVVFLPANNMDASTALCGSGPAFFALMLEAAIDGAVAMGLPRAEAIRMATQTMRGTTGLVQSGEHPSLLREKVCTPGGCTIGGLMVLEEGTTRGVVSRAVREATVIASQLGQGVQNVNGTRFQPASSK